MSVLRSNIDLGAILYSENYGDAGRKSGYCDEHPPRCAVSCRSFCAASMRLRWMICPRKCKVFCASYGVASNMDRVAGVIDEYVFCLVYPNVTGARHRRNLR